MVAVELGRKEFTGSTPNADSRMYAAVDGER